MPINQPTFNIAKVIEDSPSLKKLLDLGVDLSHWEDGGGACAGQNIEIALRLNFASDIAPRIQWLMDHGVAIEEVATIFTNNPLIFDVEMKKMDMLVDYLKSKKFSRQSIVQILVEADCKWFNFTVADIDARLGYFQKVFQLSGNEVRSVAEHQPTLVVWPGVPYQ